ncbi:MBT domain-containing protein 1 isoform X4 [Stigmatopora argus]
MEDTRDLAERTPRSERKRRDSFGMFDGYDSCSEESTSSSSSEDTEDEIVPSIPANLPIIKNNGQVYTYPDGKTGMATCEMCGMIGVRDAFYSKTKRFCSVSCSRSYSSNSKKASILARLQGKPPTKKAKVLQKQPLVAKLAAYAQYQASQQHQAKSKAVVPIESFDWGQYICINNTSGAPVSCFKHAPMGTCWEGIEEGVRIEVLNSDTNHSSKVYWIAEITKLAGFKALLRYEGFDTDSSKDFWCNLCIPDVHPVGWCASSGKPLVPPKTIQHKHSNWKTFIVKRLTGAKTLPPNFNAKVHENTQFPFKKLMRVEVVDKNYLCRTRVALVERVIGGRLRLVYEESQDGSDDFWCHMYSPLIHNIGWSRSIGHRFKRSDITKTIEGQVDAPSQLFHKVRDVEQSGDWFKDGMKLEAIDPLNLSAICVATVRKVLADGYLMIGIDGSEAVDGSDWFCYHGTSPSIFPVGFCEINNIELTSPRGYNKLPFNWFDYLRETSSTAAPVKFFNKEVPNHGFRRGMKLEAVDLMEPRLVGVNSPAINSNPLQPRVPEKYLSHFPDRRKRPSNIKAKRKRGKFRLVGDPSIRQDGEEASQGMKSKVHPFTKLRARLTSISELTSTKHINQVCFAFHLRRLCKIMQQNGSILSFDWPLSECLSGSPFDIPKFTHK